MDFSIPAYLSNFSTLDDQRTIANLKVFYIGETGDGRIFDKDFADKLVASLPYAPVVAFYSDMKDDFLGHNKTQYIYGIVKPDAEGKFELDEDGNNWYITEVMLYTDRIDNIGEVAKKIVGHKHSLELDPETVKYEMFKENGKRKIRFTDGRICGLSVLGVTEKPAFTGSEFFIDQEDIQERFKNFFSFLTNKDRGVTMDKKEFFKQYVDFISLTYNEKAKMVVDYMQTQMGDEYSVYCAEMSDNYVVFCLFNWSDYSESYKMYDYTIDEQGVSLSNDRACFRRFLSLEQIELLEKNNNVVNASEDNDNVIVEETNASLNIAESDDTKAVSHDDEVMTTTEEIQDVVEEFQVIEETQEPEVQNEPEVQEETVVEETPEDNSTFTTEGVQEDNELQATEPCTIQEEEEVQVQEDFTSSPSTLTDSERRELEAFRFEKKLNLINSYKDELPIETIDSFVEKINDFNYEELEAKLAIEYRTFSKTNKKSTKAAVFSFSSLVQSVSSVREENSYADLVRAALGK